MAIEDGGTRIGVGFLLQLLLCNEVSRDNVIMIANQIKDNESKCFAITQSLARLTCFLRHDYYNRAQFLNYIMCEKGRRIFERRNNTWTFSLDVSSITIFWHLAFRQGKLLKERL